MFRWKKSGVLRESKSTPLVINQHVIASKQAIHPAQVEIIKSIFVPTREEIVRAAKIVREMRSAYELERGAIGLDGEMIDAPMLKQAQRTIEVAEAAGLEIPSN